MESISTIFSQPMRADAIVFVSQVLLLFIVVIVSLVNLSLENGNTNLWTMVLTSCLGYMLPNPRLKPAKEKPDLSVASDSDGVVLRDFTVKRDESDQHP